MEEIIGDLFNKWEHARLAGDQPKMLEWEEELWDFLWQGTPGTGTQITRVGALMQYMFKLACNDRA